METLFDTAKIDLWYKIVFLADEKHYRIVILLNSWTGIAVNHANKFVLGFSIFPWSNELIMNWFFFSDVLLIALSLRIFI